LVNDDRSDADAPATPPDAAVTGRPRRGLLRRLDAIRANPAGRLTLRIVVGVLGAVLVAGGLLLVPLPGPGWLIVFAGLALLATEFAWAAHVLRFARRTLETWTRWLLRQGWPVRILVSVLTLACAAAIVYFMLKLTLGVDMVLVVRAFLART
jgi:uncharacterized protein (TIGR02611 family)